MTVEGLGWRSTRILFKLMFRQKLHDVNAFTLQL